ncbi:hypothetical protein THAOC_29183, partial [Thalassiosira oceanica]
MIRVRRHPSTAKPTTLTCHQVMGQSGSDSDSEDFNCIYWDRNGLGTGPDVYLHRFGGGFRVAVGVDVTDRTSLQPTSSATAIATTRSSGSRRRRTAELWVKPSNLVLLHGTKPTRTVLDELPTASDQVVRLRGLRGASHLNGTRGLTVKFDESAGRWAVRLDDTHQVVNCKPENVSLVSVLNRVLDGTPTEKNTRAALQFDVGRRVECINYYKLPQKFEHSTVAMTWVREKSWPDGLYAAYKVILDDGRHL